MKFAIKQRLYTEKEFGTITAFAWLCSTAECLRQEMSDKVFSGR